jgi:hypothetical protein
MGNHNEKFGKMGVLDFIDVGFFKKKIFEDLNLL